MTLTEACNIADDNSEKYRNDEWFVIKHNREFEVVKLSYFTRHSTKSYYKGKKRSRNEI